MGVTHSIEWNEVMRTEIQKYTLRLIIAVLACIGLMSAAHATPLTFAVLQLGWEQAVPG